MIPILTTRRLGAFIVTAGLLIPAVHGQAPPAPATEGVLRLNSDIVVTPEGDHSIALRVAAAPPVGAASTLKAGDAVTPDAIAAAAFLQGIAPAEWQTDVLYVFECWATWCGPCVAQIPHLNALHQKFKDKGLRVYGMNVWEDDRAKVEEFVKKKGDGMSYPVAIAGKEGPFCSGWLTSAGVTGIPHAFVVKNGKLLFHRHPAALTDEVVSALLAGGDREAAMVAKFAADPETSMAPEIPQIPDEELRQLNASASELGKAGKRQDAERKLDAFLEKHRKSMGDVGQAIISFEAMKAYYTAAKDEAGAVKYAEKLAAKYPDALPMLCDGGVERLKAWIVEDIKGGMPKK